MNQSPSNFAFLQGEWPAIHEAAARAEELAHSDPRSACFQARRGLELLVKWAFKADSALRLPYQDQISALVHEPTFKVVAGNAVFYKARLIITLGNHAVHSRPVQQADALNVVRELFHVAYWFARTYARHQPPHPQLVFNPDALPKTTPIPKQTVDQLLKLEAALAARDEKLSEILAKDAVKDEEIERLRREIAAAKLANVLIPDTHDYSEAVTRDLLIDEDLKAVGWALDHSRDREFEVTGMPNVDGTGFVDYVLWGDDGRPLALVEAKRTRVSAKLGQQQAKLYADCLEQRFAQRPIVFYSNGYEHMLWDDTQPGGPRAVSGFFKKPELELMIQRRSTRQSLAATAINSEIVDRYYQLRAIRRIGEAFERDGERKALVVMATGAGKTRTVIALCDQLMRANWVKRVLFLADRTALVNQAVGAFKKNLPDSSPVNLVMERESTGRVYVSTYQTMMGLIDDKLADERRFGAGHFDLVVIDEAHRSVYQKYAAIFEYFDSYLVGLTATPKEDVHSNTYGLFDLEKGVPTDAYDLSDAVKDKALVPAQAVSVPLKFPREGITYDELSEEEREQWDEQEWSEDGAEAPDRVEGAAVNKWLFNQDTVDKVLEYLMTRGQQVEGGDRIGKTIVFAKNQLHAEFIGERFDKNYPNYKGAFARVIHSKLPYAQSLIDAFSEPSKAPHIAISVDMLDTGIDVPEVVNLVFFKLVRSKTKFAQMVGRGTRLKPDLFGPGLDKKFFYIFDFCQNLEFFGANPPATEGSLSESLGTRLFKTRLDLLGTLGKLRIGEGPPGGYRGQVAPALEGDVSAILQAEVAAMNVDNFVVRARRRMVEKYQQKSAWTALDQTAFSELSQQVAGLPSEQEP
ncbi:MAG TPA: DEAD/DEAH box helicase family protein, partial [Polyangiaceae bacterium]|nr:DEAD/DEAH box helicase family protein [Polyangiaceae bacterium]